MKFILGKKIEMTQIFQEDGTVVPVTKVQAGPCTIVQVKREDTKDKYNAVQIGFDKKKNLSKALRGHLKDLDNFKYLREFSLDSKDKTEELKRGDEITVKTFEEGDVVRIVGKSKGKGFQGVVKRHGFKGSLASHGHKDQLRASGSIGSSEPARVFPGMRMAGHMGDQQVTIKNLKVIQIDQENNILYIKGAVPGARNGLLMISSEGELKINTASVETTHQENSEKEKQFTTPENKDSSHKEGGASQNLVKPETNQKLDQK